MGFGDWVRSTWLGGLATAADARPRASATFGIDDPRFKQAIADAMRGPADHVRNSANLRCVMLISNAIGMLPFGLNAIDADGNPAGKAARHPVHRLLARRPNHFQPPLVFKRAMQMQALQRGNAYALPVRSGGRVSELIPLPVGTVRTERENDLSVVHIAQKKGGGEVRYKPGELLHLMGPSEDGVRGLSMLDAARDTLDAWRDVSTAIRSASVHQANPGGAFIMPKDAAQLSDAAFDRLKADLNDDYAGAANAGKFMVIEGGAEVKLFDRDLKAMQAVESRNQMVEDIARIYGVPRPFLMLDDTSWGSGIEQLGIFFVQYALLPWFVAWEQAVMMTLLTEAEFERYQAKFNEKALLRGTMKDQAEFLSKLLGGTQQPGAISPNEARRALEYPPVAGGDDLARMAMQGV